MEFLKNEKPMKIIFFLFLILLLAPGSASAQPALYRGFSAIERLLAERILMEGSEFSFQKSYLKLESPIPEAPSPDTFSLISLLGAYDPFSGNNQFQNGVPNAINMMLWQLLLQLTADDVGNYCRGAGRLPLHPFFKAILDPICRWPAAEAKTDGNLRNFWLSVMGYDAPEEEFLAWERFALTSRLSEKPAVEAVSQLFFLITYNPHFLLRK